MRYSLPKKAILKYSLIVSIALAVISVMSSFVYDRTFSQIVFKTSTTFFLFYFTCLMNYGLLSIIDKNLTLNSCEKSVNDKNLYIFGLILTFLIILIFHAFSMYMAVTGVFGNKAVYEKEILNLGNLRFPFLVFSSLIVYSIVYFLHKFIILQNWQSKVDLENSRLRSIHAETVNQLLKQQIQPHFLFNALNVLKSLIKKRPEIAEEYLISLSNFLRASVGQNKKTLSSLKEELKICEDYMEMQKIRFGEAVIFEKAEIEDSESQFLPAFSLQPLLENAIKHNELTVSQPLEIQIRKEQDWIVVSNNLQPKNSLDESTGNGLSNLAERYRLLSGDSIGIEENGRTFEVKLRLLDRKSVLHT